MEEVVLTTPDQPCFIGAWYLPDISVCDEIVRVFETDFFHKDEGLSGGSTHGVVDKEIKDSIDAELKQRPDLADRFIANLAAVLQKYKERFSNADKVETYFYDCLNVQKYPIGGGYHAWHAEREGHNFRHLVWMTYLNDIEEGGETEFYYQKLKVKPRKGLTLIWPVDWTHTHRGLVAPNQEKMIITGWLSFFAEQPTVEEIDSLKKIEPAAA